METVAPIPAVDFNFDSACSSPYITAPSSPQRFGNFFFSAPASPTRVSSLYPPPPQWDQNKPDDGCGGDGEDFEFNFSGPLEIAYLSAADELFDGGKIRPLIKPQQHLSSSVVSSQDDGQFRSQQRGRETTTSGSSYVHKKSRSLSPLRVTDIMFEHEEDQEEEDSSNSQKNNPKTSSSSSLASSILSSISFSKANKKWKFTDLLLFRSASEGRATTGKDPLRKYSLLSSKKDCSEDVKNASFRSIDSIGSVSSSRRRRGGRASAHELHYTANRAVSEEMKRKTFLPYKQGLLGCLGFNPGMHEISKGFGSLTRG